MADEAQEVAAQITLRSEQLKDQIDKLIARQDDLQDDILTLQRRKREGVSVSATQLRELKSARKQAGRMIGALAIERTELLDDLPVIRSATGQLKVVAADLAGDASLIEDAKVRIQQVTESLQKAEKLIVKIIGLVARV